MGLVFIAGCVVPSKSDLAIQRIGEKVFVILGPDAPQNNPSKTPDYSNNNPNARIFYKWFIHGKAITPFWSTEREYSSYLKSEGIVSLEYPLSEIERDVFIKMVQPKDEYLLNIRSPLEMTFTGEELRIIFSEPTNTSK
jgi:hypothetical protein